jgi:hypothetical protein
MLRTHTYFRLLVLNPTGSVSLTNCCFKQFYFDLAGVKEKLDDMSLMTVDNHTLNTLISVILPLLSTALKISINYIFH